MLLSGVSLKCLGACSTKMGLILGPLLSKCLGSLPQTPKNGSRGTRIYFKSPQMGLGEQGLRCRNFDKQAGLQIARNQGHMAR